MNDMVVESDPHPVHSTLRESGSVLDTLHLLAERRRVRRGESLNKLVEDVLIGEVVDLLSGRDGPHGLKTDGWCSCDGILTVPPFDS